MIPRIISARPSISLAALLVVALCIFFIASRERQIHVNMQNLAVFNERSVLPTLTELPSTIDYSPQSSQNLLYRQVELEGSFLTDHEIYLENRVSQDSPKPNSKKSSGFHIMMPFLVKTGQIVWVNRGWIGRSLVDRHQIPDAKPPAHEEIITGYISLSKNDIFEMPDEHPRKVNGHVIALNFYLHDDKKDLPNRNVYPFLITQTGKGSDGLIRPEKNYFYVADHSFDLRTWWLTLFISIGFWLISGIVYLRNNPTRG